MTKQMSLVWWLLRAPSQKSGNACSPLSGIFEKKYRAGMILKALVISKMMYDAVLWNGG